MADNQERDLTKAQQTKINNVTDATVRFTRAKKRVELLKEDLAMTESALADAKRDLEAALAELEAE